MSIMRVYQDRMPAGVPGHVSRPAESTLETCLVGDAAIAYGAPVKRNATTGKLEGIATGDTEIYGFLARPYPTGGGKGGTGIAGTATGDDGKAEAGTLAEVMRRGYMTVVCAKGTPVGGGKVYVRLEGGLIETAADTGKTIEIPARFSDGMDSANLTEISYNI